MARRKLTAEQEKAMVEDIEAARDDESRWDYAHPLRRAGHTDQPLSIALTLSPAEFRDLVGLALDRGVEPGDLANDLLRDAIRSRTSSPK